MRQSRWWLSLFGLVWACSPPVPVTMNGLPLAKAAPHGELQILPGSRPVLRFSLNYGPADFRTQAVACGSFSRFQISVSGVGMPTALYPAAADAGQNHTIPATGCTLTATVANVPSGEARVARIVPYDAAGAPIPGLNLSATFDVTANPTTVNLSYRSTPAGDILNDILAVRHDPLLATQLDRVGLQALVDQITVAQGTFPNFTYLVNPVLVDKADILQALVAANGDISQLSATNPAFILTAGSVKGSLSGLVSTDKATIRLLDPISGELVNQTNGNFNLGQVPPGTWKLEVIAPPGYTSNAPATVTVGEGATVDLGAITLTPVQPTITGLSAASGAPGSTLTITGSHFHANSDGNTVVIGGVTVPASDITVISSTQLQVKVPATAPIGTTSVSVAVGSQTAANAPGFEVIPAGPLNLQAANLSTNAFDLSWGAVNNAQNYKIYQNGSLVGTYGSGQLNLGLTGLTPATAYQMEVSAVVGGVESARVPLSVTTLSNWTGFSGVGLTAESILALSAPASDTNVVWAGSAVGGSSLGGVWKCVNAGASDTCSNALAGGTSGNVQALGLHPTNSNLLLAGTAANGIYRSSDGGSSWTQISTAQGLTNANVHALAFDAKHPDTVYAGTSGGVFVSTNAGSSWSAANTGLTNLSIDSLSLYYPPTGATVIYAGTNGNGVARTTADSLSWSEINNGLNFSSFFLSAVDVRALAAHPTNSARLYGAGTGGCTAICVFLFGVPSPGYLVGVWQRDDPGNWTQIGRNASNGYPVGGAPNTGLANMDVLALAIDPLITDNVYAATQGGLYRSVNGGTSWSAMSSGLPSPTITVNTLAINTRRLYLGTTAGVFRAN